MHANRRELAFLTLFATVLLLAGCNGSGSSFVREGAFGFEIGGTPPDDAVGTIPSITGSTTTDGGGLTLPGGSGSDTPSTQPTQPPICDPLGGNNTGGSTSGLVANLRYIDPSPSKSSLNMVDFLPGASNVKQVANLVFLSQLNKVTSPFSAGFSDGLGNTLKTADGEVLDEYFALFIAGQIRLTANDPEGNYQFAVLADDGAILHFNQGSGFAEAINIDGTHPNELGCSSVIPMTRSKSLPLELGYFQAPRYHISLMLLWRNGSSINNSEPLCDGNWRSVDYFFSDDASSTPTSNYQALLDRGWSVVPAANFILPTNVAENPCD